MRKILITACCVLFAATLATAQQGEKTQQDPFLTKNGYRYLPVAGDFALGIDAVPYLKFVGNLFNSAGNNAPVFSGYTHTIYGKYFLENNRAIRAKLRLNLVGEDFKGVVPDDQAIYANPLNINATAIDIKTVKSTDIELSVGYEFRRGHGRVQGFYGGEFLIGYGSGSNKYQYGNSITAANSQPNTFDFNTANYGRVANRPTEATYGSTFKIGAGAFVGVEYFIAPQISLGGELSLGLNYWTTSSGKTTSEQWNGSAVETQSRRSYDSTVPANHFGLETNLGSTLFLMFYF